MPPKVSTPQKAAQGNPNQFSVLTVDAPKIVQDRSDSNINKQLIVINPNDAQKDQFQSFLKVLKLPKSLLQDQWNYMSDVFKKILTQMSHIGQVKRENVEYYCAFLRMVKYLALSGEKVAMKLGKDTDVIPIVLYLAFDANMANDSFIEEEIVRLGNYHLII